MKPVPNNGTIRLPLSPVGLHDSQSTLQELADPEETPTVDEKPATGMMSILPVGTFSTTSEDLATGLMSILPVETSSTDSDAASADADTQPVSDEGDDEEEKDEDEYDGPWWENAWNWVSDKLDELVETVTGSKGSS